jgi:hypothetical protein
MGTAWRGTESRKSRVRHLPDDHHAPMALIQPANRPDRPDYVEAYIDPDLDSCPACTRIWGATGWEHDRSCMFRGRRS